jgi:hypothetical protein
MNNSKPLFFLLVFAGAFLWAQPAAAQLSFKGYEHLFTTPRHYVVQHTTQAPLMDGNINEAAWQQAEWTDLFIDIEGSKKPVPAYDTRVKMMWTDSCLFIAAYLQEPHVWATLKNKDAIIYYDNDFEVFIDPYNTTHHYYEIEVNAFNTVLDLFMTKPYRNGAAAMLAYDVAQLQTAVQVQGTINNATDKDSAWTIEMAIPFRSLYKGNHWRPPTEGALWRINFSRVQWHTEIVDGKYIKKKDANGKVLPEENWVWSPQGVINMHLPERWGYLQFAKSKNKGFEWPYDESRRPYLWLLYYQQQAFKEKHGRYATTLKQLGITTGETVIDGKKNYITMEATGRQFMIYLSDKESKLTINENGLVQKINVRL